MAVELQERSDIFRQYALKRAVELKQMVIPYLKNSKLIPTGFSLLEIYQSRRAEILSYFGATLEDWENWHWQMTHRITDPHVLIALLLSNAQKLNE